jgi:hypothetical protein
MTKPEMSAMRNGRTTTSFPPPSAYRRSGVCPTTTTFEIPLFVLKMIPSASTRMIVASLYSSPLMVLKSSPSASVADRSAKIGSVVAQHFTRTDLALLLFTWQRQNDMNG